MNIDFTVWATIALMHFVAVVSPGPDFAVVLKQGLQKGLVPALWTSFGIAVAILLHVAYSILGVSLVIRSTPILYQTLLYVAAAYFIYIGISGLRSQARQDGLSDQEGESNVTARSKWYRAFGLGFLTNGLNPKATLFFLALFTAAIPASTTLSTQIFYGVYLAVATGIWFCFLSFITNIQKIRSAYQKKGYWFDRLMGIVLITMAFLLIWQDL
jgi:threonine/homoserine/homoserine lactone efflux protein